MDCWGKEHEQYIKGMKRDRKRIESMDDERQLTNGQFLEPTKKVSFCYAFIRKLHMNRDWRKADIHID